jgi:hypothetical protein
MELMQYSIKLTNAHQNTKVVHSSQTRITKMCNSSLKYSGAILYESRRSTCHNNS